MQIRIRIATPADNFVVSEIGKTTFYETWRPVNTEEDMQEYMIKSFDPELIKSEIINETLNTFLLAYENDTVVGYAKIRRDRTYEEFNGDQVIEVERIYVLKTHQDKKVGKALMDICLEISLKEKHKWIWLGVNIYNLKAIAFYKKYDFVIYGEKAFQLGEAVDNDYLMKKKLNN